jgi:DNA repair photolyase
MKSYEILPRLRRGRIVTPAYFGCLEGIPTLNVTNGCLFQCTYCYARGYSQALKEGKVYLYVNLPDLLREELSRKKVLPQWVILNTSSDCFQSPPNILRVTYEVIRVLLDYAIGISFLTKGVIPQQCLELFRRTPEKILAQVGLVSLSDRYWNGYEPYTPSPEERVKNIQRLREIGITPEIRIDPIIPFVTDTENEMVNLFKCLRDKNVKRVTLSYLHLRPAIERQLIKELSPLHRSLIESCFRAQGWMTVGSSTKTKLLPKAIREKGYERIRKIAKDFGITASICQCKNPDLKGDLCHPGRAKAIFREETSVQLPLFQC